MNKMNLICTVAFATIASAVVIAGPGGGNQPGGNQPGGGSSATWTFDTFLASSTTTSGLIIREGVITGYASPTSVTAASTVADIAAGALAGCTTLTSIDFSATSITEIPESAFAGCSNLTTVILPSICTTIGANAFAGCTKLATLTAPGVTTVGNDSFRACSALTTSPSTIRAAGAFSFAQSGVTSVDLTGMTSVGEGAFAGCESLTAATVASGATLPDALFAGCTALNVSDWSGVVAFGQAALAAREATVLTTLSNSSLPAFSDTAFIGREVSYMPIAGSVTRIEAFDLVEWLIADAAGDSPTVTQPADYNTATLKSWLATGNNAYLYTYADDLAANASFVGLTIDGTRFVYNAPTDTAISISVTPVACYTLSVEESDWSVDNLVWSDEADAYVAADATQASCFARLRFSFNW